MKAAPEKAAGTARSSASAAGARTASVRTAPVSETSQAAEPTLAAERTQAAVAPRTAAAAPPAAGARGLSARSVQRLQARAGNAAVSRLVAQRYADVVKPPPAQAPGFRKVQQDVAAKKQTLKQHKPAATESRAAQNAAVAPPDDKEAQGKTANAEKMNDAEPGVFNKTEFVGAVNEAIEAQAPKDLDAADKFADSGKADNIKNAVDGKVQDGKESSAEDIGTATTAAPDTSGATEKEVTPLNPDQPPGNPGAPSAADAVPAKQPDAVLDFREGNQQVDQQMDDAEVTEDQLARGNEPAFDDALSEKKKGEQDTAAAPGKGRAAEARQLATAKAGAAVSGAQAVAAMTADRNAAGKSVDSGKGETKSADEKKRAQVTAKLQKVFDTTQKDVEKILEDLDGKVDKQFTEGEKRARDNFTTDHKRRMKEYKDKRYSGFTGKGRWIKDKFKGLPQEGLNIFQKSRELYVEQMQTVISAIADMIGAELGRAKARITAGRNELKAEVDRLPADLKQFGEEAAADFAGKFDDLESEVNDKSTQLVQDLAQKYTEALNSVDEEIKKLEEENKGIIAAVMDAVVGVIQTILELKNMLMGVLAKAASAIAKIIKDPIGFLKNLVSALGAGLNLFIANIPDHLQKGLVSWLLGTAVSTGLAIPAKFDLKGIIQLIASLLGLTWDNIRARVTRKGVPEKAMAKVEQSVPVAGALAREGPAGAVNEIKEETGDLKKTILDDLKSYLIPTVLIAGITWILSLLTPASAFVRAVKGIIDLVTFIVTQGAQIFEFVNACLDAVIAVANGGAAGVPKTIETALATSIPLLLGLLASLLGIGGLANRVRQAFQKVSRPVNRAIDKLVDKIAKAGKRLIGRIKRKPGRRESDSSVKVRDSEKLEKVRAGLGQIDEDEKSLLKKGEISQEAAESIALNVKRSHPVFKSIRVADGGNFWNYVYTASPPRIKKGAPKGVGESDPLKVFKIELAKVHGRARPFIVNALKKLGSNLPKNWDLAKGAIKGDDILAGMLAAPLNQSHEFGRSFSHGWAAVETLNALTEAKDSCATAPEAESKRIKATLKSVNQNGQVDREGAEKYLINYKTQLHRKDKPFDASPEPVERIRQMIWLGSVEPSAALRIRETMIARIKMGVGAPPPPELSKDIRRDILRLLAKANLASPKKDDANAVRIQLDPISADAITNYLASEAAKSSDPAVKKSLEWWRSSILQPEWHHAWPQWLGGKFNQTVIYLPRILHNFDGISTDGENFPGGFHQVLNGSIRSAFPNVKINDKASWDVEVDSNPGAEVRMGSLIGDAYKVIFEPFGEAGRQALKEFTDEAKRHLP
ncbi:hypothetical protein [Streptomyces sp. NPDC091212]|uniref:phage tail protein n=1 Tax=Streptomyces sp. NPDC091212 TaxID=3155191 RepID=UPI00342AD10C